MKDRTVYGKPYAEWCKELGINVLKVKELWKEAPEDRAELYVITAPEGVIPYVNTLPLYHTYEEAEEAAISSWIYMPPEDFWENPKKYEKQFDDIEKDNEK